MIYRFDLDSLRGFAMLLVFCYHFNKKTLPAGYIGVDMFFILCGYINGLCNRNKKEWKIFYLRRILRLYPMKLLCLYFIIIITVNSKHVTTETELDNIQSALLDYSNYHFYFMSMDYFQSFTTPSNVIHFWSLSVENQFYIFFPILLSFQLNYIKVYLALYIILLIICVYESINYNSYAYYSLSSRINEFIFGMLIFKFNFIPFSNINSDYLVMVLVLLSYTKCFSFLYFPLPYLFLIKPIISNIILSNNTHSVLGSSVLNYLGQVSYSFYLFHIPIIHYTSIIYVTFSFCLIISAFTTYFIETPLRFSKQNKLILSFIIIIIISLIYKLKNSKIKFKKYISAFLKNNNGNKSTLIQSPENVNYNWYCNLYLKMCFCPFFKNNNKNDESDVMKHIFSANIIFLIGDSHLEQWLFLIYPYAQKMGYTILSLYCHGNNIGSNDCNWIFDVLSKFNNKEYVFISNYLLKNRTYILKKYITKLLTLFKLIYIIQDTPHFSINPNDCLIKRHDKTLCFAVLNKNASIISFPILHDKRIVYIDINDYLCKNRKCYFFYNGYPVYKDTNHLNLNFTLLLKDLFFGKGITLRKINNSRSLCATAIWCRKGFNPGQYKKLC